MLMNVARLRELLVLTLEPPLNSAQVIGIGDAVVCERDLDIIPGVNVTPVHRSDLALCSLDSKAVDEVATTAAGESCKRGILDLISLSIGQWQEQLQLRQQEG